MQNTTYIGISRLSALARQMDVVANNVANASTPAFKGERLMFADYVQKVRGGNEIAFVQDKSTLRDFSPGNITSTGVGTDMAIQGDGFFVIKSTEGERYTRMGRFQVGKDNQLMTPDGSLVLDDSRNPIVMPDHYGEMTVLKDGKILADGQNIATLGMVSFPNNYQLQAVKGGHFKYSGPTPEIKMPEGTSILHKSMEGSNVNPVMEMTKMIDIQRSFEAAHKLMDNENDRMRRAMQVYGRTQ